MIMSITARNVPEAWSESWWVARHHWVNELSRNGPVKTVPYPSLLTIKNPCERVLFDPVRDANPFFHVMEFVWMMAGSNDAVWLSQFNKRMMSYADDGVLRGAYGWRWRHPNDQITDTINLLRRDPRTRQAVLSMWDPLYDNGRARTSDRPCNTHIYFRASCGALDMTVTNRSNDMVWGMLGANAVHMTYLHEMIATAVEMEVGTYRVFTNNLHVYPEISRFKEMSEPHGIVDYYDRIRPFSLLGEGENYIDLRKDCENMVAGKSRKVLTEWVGRVAWPMCHAYLDRKNRDKWISLIVADDWRLACEQWADRRVISTETEQNQERTESSMGTKK